jgi:hypothetical protein
MELTPKEPATEVGVQARQAYLTFAQRVVGDEVNYATIYQQFASNDWAAIKLDDAVAEAVLRAGYSKKSAVGVLHQGPYVQHQVHQKGAPAAAMSQYVRSTVLMAMQRVAGQGQGPRRQQQPGLEME